MWRGADYEPIYTDTLHLDMGEIVPAISGPKRPQDYTPLNMAADAFYQTVADYRGIDVSNGAERMGDEGGDVAIVAPPDVRKTAKVEGEDYTHPRRLGGDRGDHLLHQHLEPLRDDRRRPRGAEGAGARADPQALGQDLAGPGQPGGQRVSRGGEPAGGSRRPRLQPRRLRLHHLHRQLRAARRPGDLQGDRTTTTSSRPRCSRATATSRAASRPTCGRTTSPRRRWSSPTRIAGDVNIDLTSEPLGQTPDGKDVYLKDIWPTNEEIAELVERDGDARGLPVEVRRRLQGRREVAGGRDHRQRDLRLAADLDLHPEPALLPGHVEGARASSPTSRARASSRCSATW